MFPDSKMANKYECGRTKTTHMPTRAVVKQITSDPKEELLLTSWYGLATDGSIDKDGRFLLVLIRRRVDKDSGLFTTSLLGMSNIKSRSATQQMYDVCNEVREAFSLDCNNCVTYSSDNTNSIIRQRNSLLQKIRSAKGDQKIFDVVCRAGKGSKQLSVNVEDFAIDIYYHFRRSAKRKNQLRKFMNFNNNEVRKVINQATLDELHMLMQRFPRVITRGFERF